MVGKPFPCLESGTYYCKVVGASNPIKQRIQVIDGKVEEVKGR
jgi:hypothetical protein